MGFGEPVRRDLAAMGVDFFRENDGEREKLCTWLTHAHTHNARPRGGVGSSGDVQVEDVSLTCCGSTFYGVQAFQEHHAMTHTLQCSVCDKSFAHPHYLDLHLIERHDATHAVQREKGVTGLFACLVVGCKAALDSRSQRMAHLSLVHAYPNNFVFDEDVKQVLRHKRKGGKRERVNINDHEKKESVGMMNVVTLNGDEEPQSHSHPTMATRNTTTCTAMDVAVGELAHSLDTKIVFKTPAKLPANFSFGQKRGRGRGRGRGGFSRGGGAASRSRTKGQRKGKSQKKSKAPDTRMDL